MRANEAITQCRLDFGSYYEKINADYINQLRVDRLMAKARHFNDMYWRYTWLAGSDCESAIKSKRIAEDLEARAKKIKEGM